MAKETPNYFTTIQYNAFELSVAKEILIQEYCESLNGISETTKIILEDFIKFLYEKKGAKIGYFMIASDDEKLKINR